MTIYAWMDVQGKCEVRRVADDQLLYSMPTPTRPEEAQAGQGVPAPAKTVCPRLSRDGRFLAAWRRPTVLAHTGPLWLWRLSEGKEPELLLKEQDVFLVSDFDQAGQHLALRYGNGDVNVYSLDPTQPARLVRRIPTGILQRPEAFALHPTRPWVALAYDDPNIVQVHDYESGELLTTLLLCRTSGPGLAPDGRDPGDLREASWAHRGSMTRRTSSCSNAAPPKARMPGWPSTRLGTGWRPTARGGAWSCSTWPRASCWSSAPRP